MRHPEPGRTAGSPWIRDLRRCAAARLSRQRRFLRASDPLNPGSAGTLFLYGIVVGAVGVAGLSLLLAGARRASRRGRAARRALRQSRRETAAITQDRDDLLDQRETARAYTASRLGDDPPGPDSGWQSRLHLFRHQPAARQAAAADPGSPDGEAAAPDVPADSRAPAP